MSAERSVEAKQYLPGPAVQKRYNVTDRTLDEWLNDEELKFPRPVYMRGRRYFDLSALEDFERSLPEQNRRWRRRQ